MDQSELKRIFEETKAWFPELRTVPHLTVTLVVEESSMGDLVLGMTCPSEGGYTVKVHPGTMACARGKVTGTVGA